LRKKRGGGRGGKFLKVTVEKFCDSEELIELREKVEGFTRQKEGIFLNKRLQVLHRSNRLTTINKKDAQQNAEKIGKRKGY